MLPGQFYLISVLVRGCIPLTKLLFNDVCQRAWNHPVLQVLTKTFHTCSQEQPLPFRECPDDTSELLLHNKQSKPGLCWKKDPELKVTEQKIPCTWNQVSRNHRKKKHGTQKESESSVYYHFQCWSHSLKQLVSGPTLYNKGPISQST